MLKKILKIFAMILLSILFLFTLIQGGLIIIVGGVFLGNIVHIFNSIVILFSIIMMGLALLKNKNTKVFTLGFLPLLILGISILGAYSLGIVMMLIVGIMLYVGLLWQLFLLRKKILCLLISLMFIPFFICAFPAYLCEGKNDTIMDVSFKWNWKTGMCEEKSTMPIPELLVEEIK